MKKLALIVSCILMMLSCASGRYVSLSNPQAQFDAGETLYDKYPEMVKYYDEGVLKITSLREIPQRDGTYVYDVSYKFVKYYYREYAERMECLKTHFPEAYEMYVNGIIEIRSLYKYVDENMEIKYHLSYRRLYDFYYETTPYLIYPYNRGYRYHYRPRPVPQRVSPPPPPPRQRPNNPPPQARPNNPPRQQPHGGGRGPRR